MTKDEAIALAKSGWWKTLPADVVASFQLSESKLCMDFGDFHSTVETALGRPVYSHEFAKPELLRAEMTGDRTPPTLDEIMAMIPAENLVVVETP